MCVSVCMVRERESTVIPVLNVCVCVCMCVCVFGSEREQNRYKQTDEYCLCKKEMEEIYIINNV